MSDRDEEMISTLRRQYEALNRGDFDMAIETVYPEVEFIRPGVEAPVRGAGALRAWLEPDALVDQRWKPKEFRVNGDKVLVRQNTRARGAASGIELDVDTWAVWTMDDDGLVTRIQGFLTHEESAALEAAGLSE
jgi:ketosteroid isomerase-like protein